MNDKLMSRKIFKIISIISNLILFRSLLPLEKSVKNGISQFQNFSQDENIDFTLKTTFTNYNLKSPFPISIHIITRNISKTHIIAKQVIIH